jgi:hypothetical protein
MDSRECGPVSRAAKPKSGNNPIICKRLLELTRKRLVPRHCAYARHAVDARNAVELAWQQDSPDGKLWK